MLSSSLTSVSGPSHTFPPLVGIGRSQLLVLDCEDFDDLGFKTSEASDQSDHSDHPP